MSEYPSEAELERVETWPHDDATGWLAFVHDCWHFGGWGWHEEDARDDFDKPVRQYLISTGGWSGNEDIIEAMSKNFVLWSLTWEQTRRGGHYIFEVPRA